MTWLPLYILVLYLADNRADCRGHALITRPQAVRADGVAVSSGGRLAGGVTASSVPRMNDTDLPCKKIRNRSRGIQADSVTF